MGNEVNTIDLLATCAFGLESVVVRELADLGYTGTPISTGRVLVSVRAGDEAWRAIAGMNLWLRAADRVLVRLGTFPLAGGEAGFDDLFAGVSKLAWQDWIAPGSALPVAGRCVRSGITSEPAVQSVTKRAIVTRLRGAWGLGPEAQLDERVAPVRIEVSVLRDVATITLDTSGVGLHKRGYRVGGLGGTGAGEAGLKETLAAGLVLLSVWRPGRPLVDPFCGSGTIAIEAAMIGRGIAPGLRRTFDAEFWAHPRFGQPGVSSTLIDPAIWKEARDEASASVRPDRLDPLVHASDLDERALSLARANARAAGVDADVQFLKRDALEISSRKEFGVIITNPPYGVRLGEARDIERLYRQLPGVFRALPTWSFHLFTGRTDLESLFGQEATRRRKLYNSTIECGYFSFLGPRPGEPQHQRPVRTADRDEHADVPVVVREDEAIAMSDEREAPPPALAHEPVPVPAEVPATRREERALVAAFGGLRASDVRDADTFARCLENNLRHLRKYPARGIACYRVYERDVPDVPLIVDRYDDAFHVVEYERPHDRTGAQHADWLDAMRARIAQVAGVPEGRVFVKEKHRQRGLSQHEKLGDEQNTLIVPEGGLRFEVNLSDYVDTGLFLDHRLTRQMFREHARGQSVLNLFCYTGSFSVYAAAGGAASTTSVDLSNTYLAWAQRNMTLNSLAGPAHRFVRADVLEFLGDHPRTASGSYDLVIADPPTFSNSKNTERDWEVGEGHAQMLTLLAPLLSSGATVYFSNNFRRFKLDEDALAGVGYGIVEISRRTVPPEYRNKRIHRCWRLSMIGPDAAREQLAQRRAKAAARAGGPPPRDGGDEHDDAIED